ncbi:MAG TPA: 50S ribosomal protein L2 [Alphaproteobacteria bacterium]|jgi:large subunit ribosomal protein L2|nr:50S ribosomal protein L2 [Alphaproteobacteria bacterium]
MALKKYRPTSPGMRQMVRVDRSELWKGKPEKTLLAKDHVNKAGRNNTGKITSWHRGGGHKQRYRIIDFKRRKYDVEATVERLEYDPNRTAWIALIKYTDGELAYIIAPQRLAAGDKVISGERADILPGNAMPIKNIPVGTLVHNVELYPGKGGQLARSAGAFVQIVGRDSGMTQIKLGSGELRLVRGDCMATVGAVSNTDHSNTVLGKAGRKRWMGWKPHNRGVVMNPVDHPHGGGEGKSSGGRNPVTPWGKPTKGAKTRKNKATDKYILRRRKNKRLAK